MAATEITQASQQLQRLEDLVDGQSHVLEMIAQGLPLSEILEAIARWVESQSRDGVLASLILLDREGQHLQHGAAPSLPKVFTDTINGVQIGPAVGSCGTAAFTRQPVFVEDIAQDPLWAGIRELALPHGLRACWSTPLIAGSGQVLGTFAMYYRQPRLPTPDDLHLIRLVTRTAILAIEHKRAEEEKEQLRQREQQAMRLQEALRASERALRETNRQMEEFLNITSHELKTPLTSLQGNIQLMGRRINRVQLDPAKAVDLIPLVTITRSLIERSERSLDRLGRLIDDLLDVARIREGRLELCLEPCDLAAVLQTAVDEHRLVHDFRTIRLELLATPPVLVLADAQRIEQVVANYLTNALKYSCEDRPVEVRLQVNGEMARVVVRDEGVGLPADEQEHIWKRFYRARGVSVQSGSKVGMGIGLHISKSIIEWHRGQVGVDSVPGQGATFWFTLPLASSVA
jgi:signal transduction histidine kinase